MSDAEIRELAEARVGFRRHVVTYLLFNVFFVLLWWFTEEERALSSYWPVWVHLGWGIGLAANAWCAYGERPDAAIAREDARIRARLRR